MKEALPTVPVHDMVIQSQKNDLVIGTHGKGFFILDDITILEELSTEANQFALEVRGKEILEMMEQPDFVEKVRNELEHGEFNDENMAKLEKVIGKKVDQVEIVAEIIDSLKTEIKSKIDNSDKSLILYNIEDFVSLEIYYIIADKFNIPLIIQGENTGLTFGVSKTGRGTDSDALKANKNATLSSGIQEYLDDGFEEKKLFLFDYDAEKLRTREIVGIWLNYYIKQYSFEHNAWFSLKHGLKIRPEDMNYNDYGTYCRYSQLNLLLFYCW